MVRETGDEPGRVKRLAVVVITGMMATTVGWAGHLPAARAAAPGPYFAEAEAAPFKGDFGNGDLALGDGAAALTVARISDTPDAFAKAFPMYPGFLAYFTLYPGAAGGGGLPLPPMPGAVEIQRSQTGVEHRDGTIQSFGQGDFKIEGASSSGDVDAETPRALSKATVTQATLPGGAVIGWQQSSSRSAVEGRDLVSEAISQAKNIHIGALSIEAMDLRVSARRLASDGKIHVASDVEFIGAAVNGIPVEISPFGVKAAQGSAPGPGDRSAEIEAALKASGVQYVRGGRLEQVERDGVLELRRDGLSFRYNAPGGPWGQEYGGGRIGYTLIHLGGAPGASAESDGNQAAGRGTGTAADRPRTARYGRSNKGDKA
jgi:hypothetical protein